MGVRQLAMALFSTDGGPSIVTAHENSRAWS